MTKTYKSDAFAAIHQTVSDLFDAQIIDKKTMHDFDESCLTPVHAFSPLDIKNLREREHVSQMVLAYHLNISKESISQWERGLKKPAGPSLKLLALIEKKGLDAIA